MTLPEVQPLDVELRRQKFPALTRKVGERQAIYFDGPAGSQVPGSVAEAVARYLLETNANHEGVFATSRQSDALLDEAHRALADFLGTSDPGLVSFGPNMTSLTFSLSRALALTWSADDEILLTRLEHDANVTPWVLAARDVGARVQYVQIHPEDCTLDIADFVNKLSGRTKLVALCCASNAVGTKTPLPTIIERAHGAGAQVFLDAVHYAPHEPLDVEAWDCDFLVCSAYKFFGPHVGVLWGKRQWLETLPAYKLRPAPDGLPGRWMTGTQNHEGIAGTLAAIEYLADLGRSVMPSASDRRSALLAAYSAIRLHEHSLLRQLLDGLAKLPRVKVWGITDPARFDQRVPTVAFTHSHRSPLQVAEHLAERGFFVWHGNFYALPLTEALNLEPDGLVRVGILHYNTLEEVAELLDVLAAL